MLGELMWQVYFALWTPKAGTAPSEGWGGDHFAVVRRADGHLVGAIATIWDTPNDAKEFADAYVATLKARFPSADASNPAAGIARSDFGKVWVKVDGAKVYIVDGGDDPKLMDKLVARREAQLMWKPRDFIFVPLTLVVAGGGLFWGGRNTYRTLHNWSPEEISCADYLAHPPAKDWVRLTGCVPDSDQLGIESLRPRQRPRRGHDRADRRVHPAAPPPVPSRLA